MPFSLKKVIRPNILELQPYRCARDDYDSGILLDANENAYGPSLLQERQGDLHRYPDPYHVKVKEAFIALRGLPSIKNVFLGVGSDEVIDMLMRVACVPAKDKILITPPTYGMYGVCAHINDVHVVKTPLIVEGGAYQLDTEKVLQDLRANPDVKLVFLCSPGNPTGTCLSHESIRAVLESDYEGLVVVDEAYVDFVTHDQGSVVAWVNRYPNLVVMQTLSKSFGLAGIRMGIAAAHPDVIQILNNTKAPYNIGTPSAQIALEALSPEGVARMMAYRDRLIAQRAAVIEQLQSLEGVGRILGGNDANFVLAEILAKDTKQPCNTRAEAIYKHMAESKDVVVRFRGKEYGCTGCLRVTIGTEDENKDLIARLAESLATL